MIRTVDLVIAGGGNGALAAAAAALHRGQRVLVVLRSRDARMGQRVRRRLHKVANAHDGQLVVATNAAVVCVDGVDGVEVVVIRHARTGRLSAVNASAFLPCGGTGPLSPRPPPSTLLRRCRLRLPILSAACQHVGHRTGETQRCPMW